MFYFASKIVWIIQWIRSLHKLENIPGIPQIIHYTHSKKKSHWIPDFSPNHQMYPLNETQWIFNVLINKNSSKQLNETTSNHHLYPKITRDIQKSSQKSNRSKIIRNQKLINLNSINKHENIVYLQWWGFILNPKWEFSYTWLRKA
jgi:hypothetical protein